MDPILFTGPCATLDASKSRKHSSSLLPFPSLHDGLRGDFVFANKELKRKENSSKRAAETSDSAVALPPLLLLVSQLWRLVVKEFQPFSVSLFSFLQKKFLTWRLELTSDSLAVKCTCCKTLVFFCPKNFHLCTRYSDQDLHQNPVHAASQRTLSSKFCVHLLHKKYFVFFCGQSISSALQRHPFSGQLHSIGELLHTP